MSYHAILNIPFSTSIDFIHWFITHFWENLCVWRYPLCINTYSVSNRQNA